jgi:hypothetical protein
MLMMALCVCTRLLNAKLQRPNSFAALVVLLQLLPTTLTVSIPASPHFSAPTCRLSVVRDTLKLDNADVTIATCCWRICVTKGTSRLVQQQNTPSLSD